MKIRSYLERVIHGIERQCWHGDCVELTRQAGVLVVLPDVAIPELRRGEARVKLPDCPAGEHVVKVPRVVGLVEVVLHLGIIETSANGLIDILYVSSVTDLLYRVH